MAIRVDPEQYADTPIFQALLADRKGRWPGIPDDGLPDPLLEQTTTALEHLAQTPPPMYLVKPQPPARTRPYLDAHERQQEQEETDSMAHPAPSD